MSNQADLTGRPEEPESGFEALRRSPEFRGPVEPLDDPHHANDHLAVIYETREELFAAVVPFVRQGLDRGERCVYVVDDPAEEEEVIDALRSGGIDVDDALETGRLTFYTAEETYLRNEPFDPEEMISFYADAVEEASEEYDGFRVTAGTNWIDEVTLEDFMEYEGRINRFFEETDSMALCHYDRTQLSREVIRDVVRTHPHLVYDGTVCHNFYYTPPEELFGPGEPDDEVDRLLGTVRDRARAKTKVAEHKRFLRELNEITADPDRSFEEKLHDLFDLGCERFDLELGALNRVSVEEDRLEVEHINGQHEYYEPGAEFPLSQTYCMAAADIKAAASVSDPPEEGFDDLAVYQEFGVEAYLGTYIPIEGGTDRTFAFIAAGSRAEPFSREDRTYLELMGQWVKYELERRIREREVRERSEHLGALVDTTPECIKTVAADGTVLQMNPAGLEMVGADSESDVIGERVYDLIAPEHRDRFREFNERICRGERGTLEFDVVGLEGTRRHMESHAAPLRRSDGTTVHVAVTRDVTERKEREAELRQTKNRFETVFEESDDGIFVLDPDGDDLVDANPAAAEMTGYTREELSSLSPSDLHPDEMEEFRAFLDEVRETGSAWSDDLHCRTKDGRDVPAEISASTIVLDGRELVLALVRDVSERKSHERYQRDLYEVTAAADLGFEEKLERLLELGCDRFGLEMGGLNHLPSWEGEFRLEKGVGLGVDPDEALLTDPDDGCYCRRTVTEDDPVGMVDVRGTSWTDDAIYREFGVRSYLGTRVSSGSASYGTLWFGSTDPRREPFSDAERSFIELMGQWIGYEIERREHEESQRELYGVAAAADLGFEEKLQAVFELGCDRFDLDYGGLARIDPATDRFEVEAINGDHEHLVPGERYPLSETYCRLVTDDGETAAVTDPVGRGFEGDLCYEQFDVRTYLGSHLEIDGDVDRTFFFVSGEPRDEAFSEAERTFHHLMGQWVEYELERKRREDRLAGLNALSRELMDAETATEVCDRVAEAADGTLDLPVTAIALYDERDGVLRPAAATGSAGDLLQATSSLAVGDGIGWNAFVENDRRRETDPQSDHSGDVRPPLTELVALPLGNHGVVLTGTTASGGFGSTDLDFVEAVTGSLTAALDRADREQQLQEREATLAEQNESLERLSRVNDIIRSIDQSLLRASTRAEIEAVVCEQLADHGAYELAWIGEHDPVTGEITPRQSAGAEKGYLDRVTVTANDRPDGRGPTGRAVRTREPQVVNDILEDGSYEQWRQAALKRGFHASVALPLVYEDSFYGVLNVYAGRPNVFDDLERAVLAELGETIAHAINAVESKKALVSDEITELEFTIADEEVDLVALSVRTDCEVSLESVVPRSDGRLRAFFSARGATSAEVLEFAPRLAASDVDLVTEHEEDGETVGLYDALLTDESLFAAMVDHGGMPRDVTVVDGTARVVVGLAADAATKEFVEAVTTKYPDSELVAQRTRERPRKTGTEHRAALTSDLTDRQLEVFQTAYFSGYFDKPRARTGTEIAASLDISQPTFNHHVRAAQRKLCRQLFEGEVP